MCPRCTAGKRVVAAVDRHSAVERELRLREDLRQTKSCQERGAQQDMQNCSSGFDGKSDCHHVYSEHIGPFLRQR